MGVEKQLHAFLISTLVGGEWSASCPGHFTPRIRAPSTDWIGCWVGPRVSLDVVAKRKNPFNIKKANIKIKLHNIWSTPTNSLKESLS
jgi:hypothetical protein